MLGTIRPPPTRMLCSWRYLESCGFTHSWLQGPIIWITIMFYGRHLRQKNTLNYAINHDLSSAIDHIHGRLFTICHGKRVGSYIEAFPWGEPQPQNATPHQLTRGASLLTARWFCEHANESSVPQWNSQYFGFGRSSKRQRLGLVIDYVDDIQSKRWT